MRLLTTSFNDFDRMVESFLTPAYASTPAFSASYSVDETEEQYSISFDLPGVKPEDIKIETHGQTLSVSGERQPSGGRTFGKFERKFTLPATVDREKIEAHHENGVLKITLAKAEAAKPRVIQVQSASGGAKQLN